jgi:hypothetical protein
MSEPAAAAAADAAVGSHFSVQPFRSAFLPSPGRAPIPWARWHAMFEDWLLAVGFADTAANAQRKAALLRASLGPGGYRLYSSLAANVHEPYVERRRKSRQPFWSTCQCNLRPYAQFTGCQQRPGETVAQYAAT